MASPASEASEIRRRGRQRLIGAVALVLLLVVFVPMILDKEPGRSQPVPSIPPRDNAPALPAPKAAPAAAPAQTPPPAVAEKPAPAPANTPAPDSRLSRGMPAVASVASVKPTTPQAAAQSASPKLEGFAVQAVMDASGSPSDLSEEFSRQRMHDAGVVLTATNTLMAEIAQDWSTPTGQQLITLLFTDVFPALGAGIV